MRKKEPDIQKLIDAQSAGADQDTICKQFNISASTLYRIQQTADYQRAAADRERELFSALRLQYIHAQNKAIAHLLSILNNPDADDAVKLRADRVLISNSITIRE